MKVSYFFIAALFLLFSCASSQKASYLKETQKKILALKPLIDLTDEQVEKMIIIEADFLKGSKALKYSPSYNMQKDALCQARLNQIKELLRRDQYIKFDMIENKRIKPTPVRVQ